jgi:transposase-like protein
MIEQDHRAIKRRVNPGMGFGSVSTAQRTSQGYEVIHMMHKGQLNRVAKGDVFAQNRIIDLLFGLVA